MRPSRRTNRGNRRDTLANRWRPWLSPAVPNPGNHAEVPSPFLDQETLQFDAERVDASRDVNVDTPPE